MVTFVTLYIGKGSRGGGQWTLGRGGGRGVVVVVRCKTAAFICLMAGLLFLDSRQRSQTQDICPVSDMSSSLGRGVDPTIRLIRKFIFWVAAFVV